MKLLDNEIITIFNSMLDMRNFEKSCIEGAKTGEIHGELHTGIGQEAVGAMIKQFCRKEDALVSTHRNHVHAIGKSVSMQGLMAEILSITNTSGAIVSQLQQAMHKLLSTSTDKSCL